MPVCDWECGEYLLVCVVMTESVLFVTLRYVYISDNMCVQGAHRLVHVV